MSRIMRSMVYMAVCLLAACSGAGGGEARAPVKAPPEAETPEQEAAGDSTPEQEVQEPAPDPVEVMQERAGGDLIAAAALLVVGTETSPSQRLSFLTKLSAHSARLGGEEQASLVLDLADRSLLDEEELALLGRGYASAGDVASASTVIGGISEAMLVDSVRAEMVRALCVEDDRAAAEQMLELVQDPGQRDRALTHLASCHAQKGRMDQAVHVAAAVQDPTRRKDAVVELVRQGAGAGHADEALDVARTIEDPVYRASALLAVGEALVDAGDGPGGAQVLRDALDVAAEKPEACSPVLSAIAEALVRAGDMNSAWTASKTIPDPVQAGWGLGAIALAHAHDGNAFMAGKVAENIVDEGVRVSVLEEIIALHVQDGKIEEAADIVKLIKEMDQEGYLEALCDLARGAAREGDQDLGDQLVMWAGSSDGREKVRGCLAVEFTRAGDDDGADRYLDLLSTHIPDVMLQMARELATRGETAMVQAMAAKLTGKYRDRARLHVVRGLVSEGRLEKALALIPSIETDRVRARSLLVIGGGFARDGEYERAADVSLQAAAIADGVPVKHFWSELDPFPGKAERALLYVSGRPQGEARVKWLGDCVDRLGMEMETAGASLPGLLVLMAGS